jgi:hypothetical protein
MDPSQVSRVRRARFERTAGAARAALAGIGVLLLASAATGQSELREFTGQIDAVDGDRIVVDNRMEDRITFVRAQETVVQGRRSAWSQLQRKDWVTVSWKFVDKPKKAYVVRVLPPRGDEE